jgi:hypothetical protein
MRNGEFLFDSLERPADSPPALLETEHVEYRKKSVAGAATGFSAGPAVAPVAMTLLPAIGVPAPQATPLIPSRAGAVATGNS